MEINGVAFKETSVGGSNSLADTFDTFLLLLTTQLQNQDPLDPLDSSQFTEQLVQFTGVEQAITTNQKLDQLVQLQTSNLLTGAVSYIGKNVEVVNDQLLLKDGQAKISYGLEANATTTVISIVNEHGRVVRSVNGETDAGRHEFEWDGRDVNGIQLDDGVFNFTVTAVDSDEQTIGTIAAAIGKVTGIEIVDGLVTLNIGKMGVPFASIFAVREAEPES